MILPSADGIRRRWKRITDRRVIFWEWRPSAEQGASGRHCAADGFWLGRYDRPEDVPVSFYRAVQADGGAAAFGRLLDGFLAGGVLWVPWIDGRPAGYLWTSRGDRSESRPDPPECDARLRLSFVTFRTVRNRDVASRALAQVCRREVAADGAAVGRCFAWDVDSVQAFEAAGFRRAAL